MQTTSPTLLRRLRDAADREAWERFVEIYTPMLYRWARASGLSDQDGCDLLQDVFVLLLGKLPKFDYDSQRGRFKSWLRSVLINKLRERKRSRSATMFESRQAPLDPEDDNRVVPFWENEYRDQLIQRAMRVMQREFEPSTWKACWETAFHGRPAAEVAAELGLSLGAVYVARSRVLRRLRQELQGLLD